MKFLQTIGVIGAGTMDTGVAQVCGDLRELPLPR
jgi:3-hydroxyacyl-CoA dehydrogenase